MSPVGRRALASFSPTAHRFDSEYARVYAATRIEARQLAKEANFAVRHLCARLPVSGPIAPVIIIQMPPGADWSQFAYESGLRPDGYALHVGQEVILRNDPPAAARPDRLAHEIVHVLFRSQGYDHLPLWLEEGVASRWGFETARLFHETQGRRLTAEWANAEYSLLGSISEWLEWPIPPADAARTRAYYRAAEEAARWIEERLGASAFRGYLAEVGHGAPWRTTLERHIKDTPFSLEEMEADIRRALENARIR